ncbi:hypothetical protein [Pseudanabaena sp. FACHB-2040]|uniref:hypothetical protein n=1 Tax=Pseudanabaena sp. FACHB-2040 TaxID=2692859 RepID=UPI001688B063|nr:hypothetical protein [Pseudanabaena sp. FACHB-2040]MBD2261234.1 hypothetical protein [Pseudanabaena sp. FACHB-2040]
MSVSHQGTPGPSNLNRRRFNQLISLAALSCCFGELAFPQAAAADSAKEKNKSAENESQQQVDEREKYHIFIGSKLAQEGGECSITFRSGAKSFIQIPADSYDKNLILAKGAALDGSDAFIILHTLYDPLTNIDGLIDAAIIAAPVMDATEKRCLDTYSQVKLGESISDFYVLDVLDTAVSVSSKFKGKNKHNDILERYQIASQNTRLTVIQTYVEEKIESTNLAPEEKQKLRGIYQFVQANDALIGPEYFSALTAVDAIVQSSNLPVSLKQRYAIASALTRAYTVDNTIFDLINKNEEIAEKKEKYLQTYNQVRLGQEVDNEYILSSLDYLIYTSEITPQCKLIYKLTRERFLDQNRKEVEADLRTYLKVGKQAAETASEFIPTATTIFGAAGVTAGTGTAISTLAGGAAMNSTLAVLGGGSVAAGGLGMLGGLAVATGGAALVGAAALVSVSLVAGMDSADLKNLSIATTTGLVGSAVIIGAAWAVASSLGTVSGLAGAAAISSAIATLGGIGVITGGTALLAFGIGLGVWQFLKGRNNFAELFRNIEPLIYTYADNNHSEAPLLNALKVELVPKQKDEDEQEGKDKQKDKDSRIYIAPEIPVNKLWNALSNFISVSPTEKVLAVIDTSVFGDGSSGIAFTDQGIWWKPVWALAQREYVSYSDPDYFSKISDFPSFDLENKTSIHKLALKLGEARVPQSL